MNRRDFLSLASPVKQVLDLSCKELYMCYVDSRIDGKKEEFFKQLRQDFSQIKRVRLHKAFWLDRQDLKKDLEPILEELRARGGLVDYL